MIRKYKHLLIAMGLSLSLLVLLIYIFSSPSTFAADIQGVETQNIQTEPEPTSENLKYYYLPLVNKEYLDISIFSDDRQSVVDKYKYVYLASEGAEIEWTGDHKTCNAGTTSDEFKYAVKLRINYFRAMAGVPSDINFREDYNQKAQEAALMMSVNDKLDHDPDPSWTCYTEDGDIAAQRSNLSYGVNGWDSIDEYMKEPGSGNYAVGHRRWVLFPNTEFFGTGDIPAASGHKAANALWVFDDNLWLECPETRDGFVAWPPPGYVPYQIVYPRWSFSYDGADFSTATVSMTSEGIPIVINQQPVVDGYGLNTIVWEPKVTFSRPPAHDWLHTITISNVIIDGVPQEFLYQVIVIDPYAETTESTKEQSETNLGEPLSAP